MGQSRSQAVVRSRKRAVVLARRLQSLLKPGAGEATELRRELADTRRRLARAREESTHRKEEAKHRKEEAKRWKEDAKRCQEGAKRLQRRALSGRVAPRPSSRPASNPEEGSLYLDLMKRTLSGWVYANANTLTEENLSGENRDTRPFDPHLRDRGADWPETAETMIGLERLDNLQACVEDALAKGVPGDLIETGVWRGGATILMRAVLKAYGVE
ncbi:MAG: TylF/MycF family methyltransferase, partial [Actinobacteria bacterium]|nr:TylF/MycF family methyltransferase [Actinomycetota bacterium]